MSHLGLVRQQHEVEDIQIPKFLSYYYFFFFSL